MTTSECGRGARRIDVRLPNASAPTSFQDARTAALYILTAYDIPLLEFLSWTLNERSLILNKPVAFTSTMWKFLLLQDQSLTQLKDQLSVCAPRAAAPPRPAKKAALIDEATPPTTAQVEDLKRGGATPAARPSLKRAPPSPPPAAARKRGSNRRIPEKENVTDCPECGRKGQSIFDPSISDREGHVWQYFYCRNSTCAKGRSCNRYIGWAIRPLDR